MLGGPKNFFNLFRVFHDLSIQLLNECYNADEETTYRLITQRMQYWGESCFRIMNLLDLQNNQVNSELITHPSFQDALGTLWNGDLNIGNSEAKPYYSSPWLVSAFILLMSVSEKVKVNLTYFYEKMWIKIRKSKLFQDLVTVNTAKTIEITTLGR